MKYEWMENLIRACGRIAYLVRWWAAGVVVATAFGFIAVYWWTRPAYRPDLMTVVDVALDGVPFATQLPVLEPNREYHWTCRIKANGKPFLPVDSGSLSYSERSLLTPGVVPDASDDRIEPAFVLNFSTPLRMGRPVGYIVATRVKTDSTGEFVDVSSTFRAPSTPANYKLQLVWAFTPGGWIRVGPNRLEQRHPINWPILWRMPLKVSPRKK